MQIIPGSSENSRQLRCPARIAQALSDGRERETEREKISPAACKWVQFAGENRINRAIVERPFWPPYLKHWRRRSPPYNYPAIVAVHL